MKGHTLGETLVEWCLRAQEEQINHGVGLVYGNYRHSHRLGLISDTGYQSFQYALSLIPPMDPAALGPREDPDFGLTAIAVDRCANYLAADPASATQPDFRICGKPIQHDGLLVSIRYSDATTPHSASSPTTVSVSPTKPLPTPSPKWPPQITWLTRPRDMLNRLETDLRGSGSTKLTDTEFFGSLVALLGLRQPSPSARLGQCKLRAFRSKPGKPLVRPHAISRGYPEKFCGVSKFGSFGSTADNRDGRKGLPESLAFAADLDEIDPGNREFKQLASKISKFVDFTIGDPVNLEGIYPIVDLHAQDNFGRARRKMLERLKNAEPNTPCARLADGQGVCPHHSALVCP